MPNRGLNKFFLSIVVPSILAITLFVISFYIVVIPLFEKNMMERKKEMILELTNTAWSVFDEYQSLYEQGSISLHEAKEQAATQIQQMRYGPERKDYFWIIDYEPRMIMHPYRKDLNQLDLKNYKDSHEKNLFTDAANLVKKQHEGFIEYYWQWKDDTSKIVPKLSYVKGFESWQWIIGTGIYLDDVKEEISYLKRRLFIISTLIIGIIILTLLYVIKQSLSIEKKRRKAEENLWLSRQKYKGLVEASTEGTLMLVDNKVIFANMKFAKMVTCSFDNIIGLTFDDIFTIKWDEIAEKFTDPNKSVTLETKLICANDVRKEIVISISKIDYSGKDGIIIISRDVSKRKQLEKGAKKLSQELQTSFQLMNQPINIFVKEIVSCVINTTVQEAAKLMSQKNQKAIFIKNNEAVIGVVNDTDLKKRVIAQNLKLTEPVSQVMSAPVISISSEALLYEAILLFKKKRVSHLMVTNNSGTIIGAISNQDCLEMQRNSLVYMIREIEISYQIDELRSIYSRLPIMVNSLISSGDTIQNISRIITSVADTITKRVIELTIENQGQPPCNFAFMAMGSEGRSEQTLKTDQDNAIVFANTETNNQAYFLELAKIVNKNLDFIGYKKCAGGIMAMNPKWCQPVSTWKKYFTQWTKSPDPQNILDSSIFFDFRCIYGDSSLVSELRNHVNTETEQNSLFFYHLAHSIVNYKPTIENKSINLKKVLLPIIGYLRVYSLFDNQQVTNSIMRLNKLAERNIIDEKRKEEIIKMYTFLMQLRIRNQVNKVLENDQPENIIQLNQISSIEESTLKKILSEISSLQTELNMEFKGGVE